MEFIRWVIKIFKSKKKTQLMPFHRTVAEIDNDDNFGG